MELWKDREGTERNAAPQEPHKVYVSTPILHTRNRDGRAEVAAWFWAAPKPVLPLYQAALLTRESFVVLANYMSFAGALSTDSLYCVAAEAPLCEGSIRPLQH